jgi:hypothetical protein
MIKRDLAIKLIELVLRPAVAFSVRHALRLQDLLESLKKILVQTATAELAEKGERINASRLSVMTGVHRRDIDRILNIEAQPGYSKDLVVKIVGQWQTDKRFLTKDGKPRVLELKKGKKEFNALIESVSREVYPGIILFELERIGAIEHVGGNKIKLVSSSIVLKGNPLEGFSILSMDVDDLIRAVEHNVLDRPSVANLHARTEFDNVRPEGIEYLKRWLLREGHQFHDKVRSELSKFDQDVNPDPSFKARGRRIVFGAFSYVDRKRES